MLYLNSFFFFVILVLIVLEFIFSIQLFADHFDISPLKT